MNVIKVFCVVFVIVVFTGHMLHLHAHEPLDSSFHDCIGLIDMPAEIVFCEDSMQLHHEKNTCFVWILFHVECLNLYQWQGIGSSECNKGDIRAANAAGAFWAEHALTTVFEQAAKGQENIYNKYGQDS